MKYSARLALIACLAAAAACDFEKTHNPLQATVAGVNITAPRLVSPSPNAEIAAGSGPIVLVIENSTSTGERPVFYSFHLAADAAFGQTVAAANEVPAGSDGRTQWQVPVALSAGRTYHWRAQAGDGANVSPFSEAAQFAVNAPPAPPPPPPPPAAPAPAPAPPPAPTPPSQGTGIPSESEGMAMVAFVKADLQRRGISMAGECGAFEITKRVAWAFRHRGAGLENKPGGRNCQGYSQDIILFPGQSIDMLIGSGGENEPAWQIHIFPDWAIDWRPPFDPDGEN